MKIMRAYKTKLDPTQAQRQAFVCHCGAARFVYNWALADRMKTYQETGKSGNLYEQRRRFNALKKTEYPWLSEIAYKAQDEAFVNLDRAYQNFFRRLRKGDKPGFPKFKSRKSGLGSFTLRGSIHVGRRSIQLPVIGRVRLSEQGYLPRRGVKVLSATISERARQWFLSLQVEQEIPDPQLATGEPLGIDLGIKTLAVCSDGATFDNPHSLQHAERKMARLQRELCRRKKGSKNREKTKRKIARLHHKIACIRQHTLHNISCHVTAKAKPSIVVLEDLDVKGMLANRHLSKAISDASFSELRRQIEYKAQWHGVRVLIADRFYPSSKTCGECGYVNKALTLADREWACPQCGAIHDRDGNAARNLASLAVGQLCTGQEPALCACGVGGQ